jgi:hypothetical protein
MDSPLTRQARKLIEYDAVQRRLWVLGQRCHHGATGALLTATALGAFATARLRPIGLGALAATGSLLMIHDWKDREMWFQRGPGSPG